MHDAGDNRDCTYLSTLPFNTLDAPDLVLLVAGVNHVKAGRCKGFGLDHL
jgi:hypothetical protein